MASPLRPDVMFGTRSGIALDQGAVEAERAARRAMAPGVGPGPAPLGPNVPNASQLAADAARLTANPAARTPGVTRPWDRPLNPGAPSAAPAAEAPSPNKPRLRDPAASRRAAGNSAFARSTPPVPAGTPAPAPAPGAGNFASKLRGFPAAAAKSVASKVTGVASKVAAPLLAGSAAYDGLDQAYNQDVLEVGRGNFNNSTGAATGMDQRRTHWPDTPVGRMQQVAEAGNGAAQGVVSNLGSAATFGALSPEEIGRAISGAKNRWTTAGDSLLRGDFARAGEAIMPGGATDAAFNQRQIPLATEQLGKLMRPEVGNNSTGDASTLAPETFSAASNPQGVIEVNGKRLSPERMAQLESRAGTSGIDFGQKAAAPGDDIRSMLRDMMTGGGRNSGGAQGAVIEAPGQGAFDKLKAEVIAAHDGGRVAKGTLAKKLMQIEEMRQGRQTADQGNQTTMRGQDLAAQEAGARTQALLAGQLADYDASSSTARTNALRAQSEMGEKGFDRFQKLTTGLFQTTDKDGKPTNDTAKEERFRQYMMASDLMNENGGLLELSPQEQAALIAQQRSAFEVQEEKNMKSGNWGGMTSNTATEYGGPRDPELGDLRKGLGFGTYLNQELNPLSDGNVIEDSNGQVRSRSELVGDDVDRLRVVDPNYRLRR